MTDKIRKTFTDALASFLRQASEMGIPQADIIASLETALRCERKIHAYRVDTHTINS